MSKVTKTLVVASAVAAATAMASSVSAQSMVKCYGVSLAPCELNPGDAWRQCCIEFGVKSCRPFL